MECLKCKKEIGEDFRFCPYCGSKTGKFAKPSFTNAEYLTVCPNDAFKKEFETLKSLSAEDAQKWLHNMHDPVTVYGLYVDYTFNHVDEGRVTPRYTDERSEFLSPEMMDCFLPAWEKNERSGFNYYTPKNVRVEKRNLTKTRFKDLGETLFFTKEECEEVKKSFEAKYFEG